MNCSQGTKDIIRQINELLCQLDSEGYSKPVMLFKGGTLGQHFRHILDFYNCLIEGSLTGHLDYSKRARNPLMETSVEVATAAFTTLLENIEQLEDDRPLQVMTDFSIECDGERSTVASSVGRELMYAYDHAVHHLAIIRMGIQTALPDVQVNDRLGVAPSTVKHQMKQ